MKNLLALLSLAAVATMATSVPAHAFTPGGTFTLSGPMTMNVGSTLASCTLTMTVYAPPGAPAQVVNATLTPIPGSTMASCSTMRAMRLPWAVSTPTPTTVVISPVQFSYVFNCASSAVSGTWNNTFSTLTWTSVPAPICVLGGTFSASPAQTLP